MSFSRRDFLKTLAITGGVLQGTGKGQSLRSNSLIHSHHNVATSIDRAGLIKRHNPVLTKFDVSSPLSLGNGEFAFTADVTGLQTFPEIYDQTMPLCTMSQWGWHTSPLPTGLDTKAFRLTQYDTHGRSVGYAVSSDGQKDLYNWLRENPHRLHLGRIGFVLKSSAGRETRPADITDVEQTLDMWRGLIISRFRFEGKPVIVRTSVHPKFDLLAAAIESPLISEGRLAIRFAFPYGSSAMQAADWKSADKHRTELNKVSNGVRIRRTLDSNDYFVAVQWNQKASFATEAQHDFILSPDKGTSRFQFVASWMAPVIDTVLTDAEKTFSEAAKHWEKFWSEGAAVELIESKDPRAAELERRIVLSQYLTAIQCAGSMPPQETGLTVNSWYGKFHLEMHWWHAAHFALWNRPDLLEKSLGWYNSILLSAKERAKTQGYGGARWPKMVGPEGRDSPSPIGPLLIWQQPHPIFYAEFCYLTHRDKATVDRYREIVFETAEFMASFAYFDANTNRYVLGPPVIPAQENHPPKETWNPTFELAYWAHGLNIAQQWRERLGMSRDHMWDEVISRLSALPQRDDVYLAHENCPQTYTDRNRDHPSMLGAYGVLPGEKVDPETMRRTLNKVMKEWQWDKTWGWDYPMAAMTAARLGESNIAVDALMMKSEKNKYLPNGHNWQRQDLPCYLPGNGGLLYATAMMAAGWKGSPAKGAPGFPGDGTWTIRSEGFNSAMFERI